MRERERLTKRERERRERQIEREDEASVNLSFPYSEVHYAGALQIIKYLHIPYLFQ